MSGRSIKNNAISKLRGNESFKYTGEGIRNKMIAATYFISFGRVIASEVIAELVDY